MSFVQLVDIFKWLKFISSFFPYQCQSILARATFLLIFDYSVILHTHTLLQHLKLFSPAYIYIWHHWIYNSAHTVHWFLYKSAYICSLLLTYLSAIISVKNIHYIACFCTAFSFITPTFVCFYLIFLDCLLS